ncbi:MAG: restriction endonuclease [Burkholderiales bacterium]|jgi:restriction system protein|nr:restriction endonuclease [Burkholderiales bacterium]
MAVLSKILKNSGHSGDGGIDGIIKEDILGFDKIYIQAKRWNNDVGSKEIRDFIGALQIQNASKGLFVTTSKYTKSAIESLYKLNNTNIILIDGMKLAELMIKYNVGVYIKNFYELKQVDEDYFIID